MKTYRKLAILIIVFVVSINGFSSNKIVFNIIDYGAVADGKTINTKAIQQAIDDCSANKGGTVLIPPGIFMTGTFELKSNVNLQLETGSEIKGSPDINDYKFYQSPIFKSPSYYGIVYAYRAENISITGQGAINGNEEVFFEWDKAYKIDSKDSKDTRQNDQYRKVTSGIGDGPVVPKERPRQMVILSECKNVLLRDIRLIKSTFWTLHLADCDGVIVSGLKIWSSLEVPNNDGIDITSCNNVIVSDCDIRTGDDAIIITGYSHHYELPGYNDWRHPSANITITNCNLQSRSSGIRIGYIDQNSIKNININNINITNSNRGIGIFLRGEGSIENVNISQVNIETHLYTGNWWGNGEPIHISAVNMSDGDALGQIRNVNFRDITCTSENGILIYGSPESNIDQVRFDNIKLKINKSPLNKYAGGNIDLRGANQKQQLFASDISGIYGQYIKNLKLNDVDIRWGDVNEEYFKNGIHITNFENLKLSGIIAEPSPSNKSLPAILLENGSNYSIDDNSYSLKTINVKP